MKIRGILLEWRRKNPNKQRTAIETIMRATRKKAVNHQIHLPDFEEASRRTHKKSCLGFRPDQKGSLLIKIGRGGRPGGRSGPTLG